jgi:hypothetical protein
MLREDLSCPEKQPDKNPANTSADNNNNRRNTLVFLTIFYENNCTTGSAFLKLGGIMPVNTVMEVIHLHPAGAFSSSPLPPFCIGSENTNIDLP